MIFRKNPKRMVEIKEFLRFKMNNLCSFKYSINVSITIKLELLHFLR